MLTGTEIRRCGREELDAIEAAMPSPGRSRYHHARFEALAATLSTYLIAWDGDRPVGHVLLSFAGDREPEVQERLGSTPVIGALGVHTEYRQQGVGAALVTECERLVEAAGLDCVYLLVGVENAAAARLYGRLGFRDWGQGEVYTDWGFVRDDGSVGREGETCRVLVKPLAPSC